MRKLSKYEKETIINWNEAENLASVYTFNASLKLDKSRLSIRLVPPYSEERKAAAREYAKEHGFQVVGAGEKIA